MKREIGRMIIITIIALLIILLSSWILIAIGFRGLYLATRWNNVRNGLIFVLVIEFILYIFLKDEK